MEETHENVVENEEEIEHEPTDVPPLVALEVLYCGGKPKIIVFREAILFNHQSTSRIYVVCGLPPDFCEFGPSFEQCKPWLKEHCPDLYPELSESEPKAEGEEGEEGESEHKPRKRGK